MAMTAVTPVSPREAGGHESGLAIEDPTVETRVNLTRPPDRDNELVKVAAMHGPQGILAVMRARKEYGWFVVLCFRAIEICLGPRHAGVGPPALQQCDPVEFAMQMLELEMIDEVFQLMKYYGNQQKEKNTTTRDIQRTGLAIMEILIMDDPDWRDEVARRGGVALLCEIARQRKDSPNLMCQVMTCMSYLAAEDYIEVMLCQHEALEYVSYILRNYVKNSELVTRASLALLNLTVCEPHIMELVEKDAILPVLEVYDTHSHDIHLVIILCGILANFSVKEEVREMLVEAEVLRRLHSAMHLDPENSVLQVACLKALVNYSTRPEYYFEMERIGLEKTVSKIMVEHAHDPGVQKYGDYFLGHHTSCPIL